MIRVKPRLHAGAALDHFAKTVQTPSRAIAPLAGAAGPLAGAAGPLVGAAGPLARYAACPVASVALSVATPNWP